MSDFGQTSVAVEEPETVKHVGPAALDDPNRPAIPDYVDQVKVKGWGDRVQYDYGSFERGNERGGEVAPEFGATAARYEWNEEYEQSIAPRIEALESQLFGSDFINRPGEKLDE